MIFFGHSTRRTLLVFAGITVLPAAAFADAAPEAPEIPADAAKVGSALTDQFPSEDCLARTVCTLKDRVRWRTAGWTPEFCQKISRAVITSSKRHHIPPALLLAVMINESDMNEKAVRLTERNGAIYAKDSGLMGIRCVVDKHGRCQNGNVRGILWKTLMDPLANIELGARELSTWKNGAGVTRAKVRVRDKSGRIQTKEKWVRCEHKTHAYWAHYNHGPRYVDTGHARHYPHRVAVLYYALAKALQLDAPELAGRITIIDPGKRPRTADRPLEPRYRKLCEQIYAAGSVCTGVASAAMPRSMAN